MRLMALVNFFILSLTVFGTDTDIDIQTETTEAENLNNEDEVREALEQLDDCVQELGEVLPETVASIVDSQVIPKDGVGEASFSTWSAIFNGIRNKVETDFENSSTLKPIRDARDSCREFLDSEYAKNVAKNARETKEAAVVLGQSTKKLSDALLGEFPEVAKENFYNYLKENASTADEIFKYIDMGNGDLSFDSSAYEKNQISNAVTQNLRNTQQIIKQNVLGLFDKTRNRWEEFSKTPVPAPTIVVENKEIVPEDPSYEIVKHEVVPTPETNVQEQDVNQNTKFSNYNTGSDQEYSESSAEESSKDSSLKSKVAGYVPSAVQKIIPGERAKAAVQKVIPGARAKATLNKLSWGYLYSSPKDEAPSSLDKE